MLQQQIDFGNNVVLYQKLLTDILLETSQYERAMSLLLRPARSSSASGSAMRGAPCGSDFCPSFWMTSSRQPCGNSASGTRAASDAILGANAIEPEHYPESWQSIGGGKAARALMAHTELDARTIASEWVQEMDKRGQDGAKLLAGAKALIAKHKPKAA